MDETGKEKKFTPPPLPLKDEKDNAELECEREHVFSPPPLPNAHGNTIGHAEVAAERIPVKEKSKKRIRVKAILAIIVVIIIAVIGVEAYKSFTASDNQATDVPKKSEEQELVCINQAILSDVGNTYQEIENKYGKMIESDFLDGGRYFMFENSPAIYYFVDKEGDYSNPHPNDDAWCYCMDIAVKHFFDNFDISMQVYDLEQELGVSLEVSVNDMDGGYMCAFEYNGYDIQIDMGESETTMNENRLARVFDNE